MTDETQKANSDPGGVGGLTEILKLQAEALARMSERMAGQQAPPLSGPPLALPPRFDGTGGHLPIMAGDPAMSEEGLPVLSAFRKFLETERRKARRRFVWMSVLFAILMGGVLAAAAYLWSNRVRELRSDIAGVRTEAAEAKVAAQVRTDAGEKAQRVAEIAVKSVSDVKNNLSAAQSNLAAEVVSRSGEIDRLKEMISSLQLENAVLISQVNALTKKTAEMEAGPPAEEVPDTVEPPVAGPGAGRELPKSYAVPTSAAGRKVEEPFRISAPGLSGSVQLHLPETP